MSILRRQLLHLAALPAPARFAFVRDSSTGQAALLDGTVTQNPGPNGGVLVTVHLPGTASNGKHRAECIEWS